MTASQLKTDVLAKNKEVEKSAAGDDTPAPQTGNPEAEFLDWKDQLLTKLRSITPSAFERLSQRLLRESGFEKVEVTGKTGAGGIDGPDISPYSSAERG